MSALRVLDSTAPKIGGLPENNFGGQLV